VVVVVVCSGGGGENIESKKRVFIDGEFRCFYLLSVFFSHLCKSL